MENFMLWGVSSESGSFSLSFLATRIQLQYIHHGTREMIDRMLIDIGLHGIEYNDWSILYFFNNYYSSAEEKISSQDAWSDTWEITLKLTKPASTNLALSIDDKEICRTYARDDTWDGTLPALAAPYVIVARFYNQQLFTRAITLFSEIQDPRGKKDLDLNNLIDKIQNDPLSYGVSAKKRSAFPIELAVELGTFDEASFSERGTRLAELVSELIYELGATITWEEKANYLKV